MPFWDTRRSLPGTLTPESADLPTAAAARAASDGAPPASEVPVRQPARGLRPAAVASALVACLALLATATIARLEQTEESRWRRLTRRYWEDTYLAIGHHLTGRFPVAYPPVRGYGSASGRGFEEVRPTLTQAAEAAAIRSWQFWRTIPAERFIRPKPMPIFPRYDDSGRPLLLSLGFTLLGGVSPFLLFWIGLFAATPVLAWVAAELSGADAAPSAAALLLLLGLSPFVAHVLALSYSALGFYLVALFALGAFASYACLRPSPSARGLLARAMVAGLIFGVSSTCRATCLLLLPGFLIALLVGAIRGTPSGPEPRRRSRVFLLSLAAAAALVLPYLATARAVDRVIARTLSEGKKTARMPPQVHPFWHGVWIGLGDFDRTKGYIWDDQAAFKAIVEAGGAPSTTTYYDPDNEAIARTLIVNDVLSDPAWFAGILLRRLGATLTQWKLRPWPPLSGRSIAEGTGPNERLIDSYYSLAAPVDRFGIAGREIELPIPMLLAPTVWLVGIAVVARHHGRPDRSIEKRLAVVTCIMAATIGHPVLLTTASALETETFAITYILGAAFAIEELVRRRGRGAEDGQPLESRIARNSSMSRM